MPDLSDLTEDQLARNVASLVGTEVSGVRYLLFPHDEWDGGEVHEDLMAVELLSTDGTVTSFTWGDSLGEFNIEVRLQPFPAADYADLSAVSFEQHARWTPLTPGVVQSASTAWGTAAATDDTPIAVRLQFQAGAVWIAAGERQDTGWILGMDEIAVMFGDEVAARCGLNTPVGGA